MPLTEEERKAIVVYRLEKAEDAFVEAKDCASMGHRTLAASRLLVSAGYTAKTHEGTICMIGRRKMLSLISQRWRRMSAISEAKS